MDGIARRHGVFAGLLLARYLLPLLLTGSIAARVHDNLDSEVVYSVVIGRFWASGADPAAFSVFLGGVLGWADFARVLQPLSLLYALLPPVWAYAATDAALLLLAYAGMRALLAALGLRAGAVIPCLAAFGMSYTSYGAGLAGAPLLLALVFRAAPPGWAGAAAALLIGANAGLALHGFFLPVALAGLALMTGRWPGTGRMLGLMALFVAGSVASSVGMIAGALSGVPSHRLDWPVALPETPLADWAAGVALNLLTMGNAYHAVVTPALHVPVILAVALATGGAARRAALWLAALVALAVAVRLAEPWLVLHLPGAIGSIQWHRFLLFLPLLALVVAAMARPSRLLRGLLMLSLGLSALAGMGVGPSALKSALPPAQVAELRALWSGGDRAGALRQAGAALAAQGPGALIESWDRHIRPRDYACLRTALGEGRVLSHGPDPMLAPFHGIPAIDGYHNLYPLAWKRAFRPVIAARLAASAELAEYYDDWGNRVSTLAGRLPGGPPPDLAAAAALGAGHVIAGAPMAGTVQVAECGGLLLLRIEDGEG